MGNLVALSNVNHKNIKIDLSKNHLHAENVNIIPIIPAEFANVATEYPIVITKNEKTGKFLTCAVLGFDRGENLFFKDGEWNAMYLPLQIQRQPFFVGDPKDLGVEHEGDHVVCFDPESPTVSESEGQALFNEDGSDTDFFVKSKNLLGELLKGEFDTEHFVNAIQKYDLLQPMQVQITFNNEEKRNLNGLYSIDMKKLAELSDEDYIALRKNNYLQAFYIMAQSTNQIYKLIEMKNKTYK